MQIEGIPGEGILIGMQQIKCPLCQCEKLVASMAAEFYARHGDVNAIARKPESWFFCTNKDCRHMFGIEEVFPRQREHGNGEKGKETSGGG